MPTSSGQHPCHLLHVFPSFEVGGAQRRFVEIANRFGSDVSHSIFAMDGCYDALSLISGNVTVNVVDLQIPARLIPRVRTFKSTLAAIHPRRLITYNWGTIEWAIACRFAELPHVHVEDGFGREEASRRFLRRTWTRRAVLRPKTQVILPSNLLLQVAKSEWKIPARQIHYVPNGVDIERFTPKRNKDILATHGVPVDRLVIGTVAGLRKEKNIFRLLSAFKDLPSADRCHLVIVGDGTLRGDLEAESKELGIGSHVTFLGPISEPETVLAGFDVFALSSDTEQMPLSVLEAMACGLPIASVDVGDVKAMVSERNREFVTEKNHIDLSVVMEQLASSPSKRAELGTANRAKAEDSFSMGRMMSAYRELFLS